MTNETLRAGPCRTVPLLLAALLVALAAAGCGRNAGTEAAGTALFEDEAAALAAYRAKPTAENRAALARLRAAHAVSLLELAQSKRDPTALELALKCAHGAKNLEPENGTYWFLLSQVYGENPDNPATLALAQDAARKALERAPGDHRIRLHLAQVLFRQKFFKSALDNLELAVSADPSLGQPKVLSMMTMAYVLDGLAARGETFMAALVAARPGNDAARLALAVLLHHQGGPKDAAAYAELDRVKASQTASEGDRRYAVQLAADWRREVPIGGAFDRKEVLP